MILKVHSDPPPLRECDDGVVRIADTRIPLERVVRAFQSGATPEQIAQDYDVLAIEDVYAVITYYLRHRREVDEYVATVQDESARARSEIEDQFNPSGIRERLLARRVNGEG